MFKPIKRQIYTIGAIFSIAVFVFLVLLERVLTVGPLIQTDIYAYKMLQSMRTPLSDSILITITELGDTVVVVIVSLALFVLLLAMRAWRTAVFWVITIVGATTLNSIIKVAINRPRPIENLYTGWSNYSFPSGHSTINFVMYGFISILLCQRVQRPYKIPLTLTLLSFALLIAFSRVYLGAHWASDVLGSIALGTAWLTAISALYSRVQVEPFSVSAFTQTLCAALLIAGIFNVSRDHRIDQIKYGAQPATLKQSLEN